MLYPQLKYDCLQYLQFRGRRPILVRKIFIKYLREKRIIFYDTVFQFEPAVMDHVVYIV